MTPNMKAILTIIGAVLTIFGMEVLKQDLQAWIQITNIKFIAGECVQLGALIIAIAAGVKYDPTARTFNVRE